MILIGLRVWGICQVSIYRLHFHIVLLIDSYRIVNVGITEKTLSSFEYL